MRPFALSIGVQLHQQCQKVIIQGPAKCKRVSGVGFSGATAQTAPSQNCLRWGHRAPTSLPPDRGQGRRSLPGPGGPLAGRGAAHTPRGLPNSNWKRRPRLPRELRRARPLRGGGGWGGVAGPPNPALRAASLPFPEAHPPHPGSAPAGGVPLSLGGGQRGGRSRLPVLLGGSRWGQSPAARRPGFPGGLRFRRGPLGAERCKASGPGWRGGARPSLSAASLAHKQDHMKMTTLKNCLNGRLLQSMCELLETSCSEHHHVLSVGSLTLVPWMKADTTPEEQRNSFGSCLKGIQPVRLLKHGLLHDVPTPILGKIHIWD
ncbi:uncharacterized protein LOC125632808 [Caretta caretta]|uniref:uncharacterized protein LOC125632808 n=1 Tax=Caretta caretta TaxID=8467 RepID=UPI003F4B76A9